MKKNIILLVEDNSDDVILTLRAFKKSKLLNEVVVVGDGVEALDYLFATGSYEGRDPNAMPNLVLIDLKLPKMDGMEVLRRLRADSRTKLLPVIILTSSLEEQDVVNAYDLRANSYIRKPVDFLQFSDAIQQLGLYWQGLNEAPPRT